MKKLNWLAYQVLIVIMASSLTGCAMVRIIEKSSGIGVTETVRTETRNTSKLERKDVKLNFTPIGNGLGFQLRYQPHYQVERRSITHQRDDGFGPVSILVGLAETVAFFVAVLKDDWVYLDAQDEFQADWSAAKSWQKALVIGVPLDLLMVALLSGDHQSTTRWKRFNTRPGSLQEISHHPVSISLPQFGYQSTRQTGYNGSFTISTNNLIDIINEVPRISDLNSALQTKAIKIGASVYFEGEEAEESFTIYERLNRPLFQALYKKAEKLRNAQ